MLRVSSTHWKALGIMGVVVLFFWGNVPSAAAGCCAVNSHGELYSAAKKASDQAAAFTVREINRQVLQVGQDLLQGEIATQAILQRLADAQRQGMYELFMQFGKAQAEVRAQELYGPGAETYNGCCNEEVAREIQQAEHRQRQVRAMIDQELETYNRSMANYDAAMNRLSRQKDPDLRATVLFPRSQTLSAEQTLHTRNYLRNVTNPLPEPPLPEPAKTTSAGHRYTAAKNAHDAYLSLSQVVLRDLMEDHTGTLALGRWAQNQWTKMGEKGPPPGVVDGYMSPAALRAMQSRIRHKNPAWYSKLESLPPTSILREIAFMGAARMEMERQNLKYQKRIAAMLAVEMSRRVKNEMSPVLERGRNKAIQQIDP